MARGCAARLCAQLRGTECVGDLGGAGARPAGVLAPRPAQCRLRRAGWVRGGSRGARGVGGRAIRVRRPVDAEGLGRLDDGDTEGRWGVECLEWREETQGSKGYRGR